MQCMRLIKKGGQALSLFVLVLRHSSMDSFGVRSLGSAAAQGGQDTFPEHENGSPLTGWDASVQASRDASYHGSGTGQMGSSEASKAVGSSDASSYLQSPHTYYAQTPQNNPSWGHSMGPTPAAYSSAAYVPYMAGHGSSVASGSSAAPYQTPVQFHDGAATPWQHQNTAAHPPASPWHQQYQQQLVAEQRGRAEAQQQLKAWQKD